VLHGVCLRLRKDRRARIEGAVCRKIMETYCPEKKMVPASRGAPCLSLGVCLATDGQHK
jgi:hypothetical protein